MKTPSIKSVEISLSESIADSSKKQYDPQVEEYYHKVYSSCNYECYSEFDPQFEWTEDEEKKIVKKLDYRVAYAACIMFIGLNIDRGNLGQAVTDNFLDDLGMTTNNYNTGNTIFKVAFILAEVPSQLISKALGPDVFIPFQICAWSLVAMSQVALTGPISFYVTRGLIGMLEGGFIADLVLWLSYFFTSKELPVRLSWFWGTSAAMGIITSVLAFGILRMRGIAGLAGWRWLFLLEGSVTFLIGLSSFYMMVPSAVQTKNWLHPKGWFSDREVKIVVNRILRDDPSKGSMHNRQGISAKMLFESLIDYDLWPLYLIGVTAYVGSGTFGAYFGLINRRLGFNTFDTNLLNIPHQVLHVVFLLSVTWFSERVNEKSFVCMLAPLYALPLISIIRWWPGAGIEVWPTWTLNTLYLSQPYIHAICVAWVSRNSNSVRTRSIASAVYNMFVQLGGIIGSNIYREDDLPLYHRGNTQIFWFTFALIPILAFTKLYYYSRNKYKARVWNSMTEEERESYRKYSTDEGAKRLDFFFVH
ncbi:uncharacterized protein SPAPADRAFT_72059 [Spathaspora passalidarum NRRL Y-27907]|uniref:Major facilitator superfamily (MFS) profile domain-containing protein n=1 Tax=Spathaspora passalidarum (strain NRRL Y-27907 / 11-Y1) TaxID=619300 RepID=G3AQX5_SPAPN|nr:uncharacterized protein SPAPADRAFT_72059 [Spathaspora passalidarum NRRL Y-27907]EGW31204.1 hypothetical protein SPAPADRAFT_72059 [Spathaspora passalidarum NRRL Y-27907]